MIDRLLRSLVSKLTGRSIAFYEMKKWIGNSAHVIVDHMREDVKDMIYIRPCSQYRFARLMKFRGTTYGGYDLLIINRELQALNMHGDVIISVNDPTEVELLIKFIEVEHIRSIERERLRQIS